MAGSDNAGPAGRAAARCRPGAGGQDQGQRPGRRPNTFRFSRVYPNAPARPLIRGAQFFFWGIAGNYREKLFRILGNFLYLIPDHPHILPDALTPTLSVELVAALEASS
jgi:hypothetical protein